jgi:hypothetical protein
MYVPRFMLQKIFVIKIYRFKNIFNRQLPFGNVNK